MHTRFIKRSAYVATLLMQTIFNVCPLGYMILFNVAGDVTPCLSVCVRFSGVKVCLDFSFNRTCRNQMTKSEKEGEARAVQKFGQWMYIK